MLRLTAASTLRPLARSTVARQVRTVTTLKEVLYTAKGQAGGQGRNGKAHLTAGEPLEVKLAMPKELGGKGDGHDPEQLFSMGYAACFLSAINLSAGNLKVKLPAGVKVDAEVDIGKPSSGNNPFGLAVRLIVSSDSASSEDKANLQKVVEKAHEVCPYSNATRGNIPVELKVQ